MDAIEAMARAMEPRLFKIYDQGYPSSNWLDQQAFLNAEKVVKRTRKKAAVAFAALRDPELLEALCRKAADPKTADVCWAGVTQQLAAEIVHAVLCAALGEGEHG